MIFPDAESLKDGFWRPIYFRANFDTPERLVAAVLAYSDGKWSLQKGSALERLKCLYGSDSVVALETIRIGLDDLEKKLLERSDNKDFDLVVSGLEFGKKRRAQTPNADVLAQRFLRLTSSLHDPRREFSVLETESLRAGSESDLIDRGKSRDRLSVLVMEQMTERNPEARNLFNPHVLKLGKDQSARLLTHKAYVAYDGRNVAANFSTLKAGRHKTSVNVSKRLMWDLEQHRDESASLLEKQAHEMFLYYPSKDDPTITERQYANVLEVVDTLRGEGKNRDIEVVAFDSVTKITENLLSVEGFS